MQLSKLASKYQKKWNECDVTLGLAAENIAKRIIANKSKYETVSKSVGYIPWWLIGCLHNMESGMSFNGHASNGDPLSARTRQVPKGEPRDMGEPPYTWEETAISIYRQKKGGLNYLGLGAGIDSIIEALHFAQAFNGFGYEEGAGRATVPPSSSPYLWAGTNQYVQGKYVSDGRFDSRAVSAQIGVATIMKKLQSLGVEMFDSIVVSETPLVYKPVALPIKWHSQGYLSYGSHGDDVFTLSCALSGLGFLDVREIGYDFDNEIKQAVLACQKEFLLEVDGIVGGETKTAIANALYRARKQPEPMAADTGDVLKNIAQLAKLEARLGLSLHSKSDIVWQRYIAPLVEPMKSLKHIGDAYMFVNWCACFVTYIHKMNGINFPDIISINGWKATPALVDSVKAYAQQTGCYVPRSASPKIGYTVFFDWDGDNYQDHIGIVLEVHPEHLVTAEGNRRNVSVVGTRSYGTVTGYADFSKLHT